MPQPDTLADIDRQLDQQYTRRATIRRRIDASLAAVAALRTEYANTGDTIDRLLDHRAVLTHTQGGSPTSTGPAQ